jgi:protein arginine kinase
MGGALDGDVVISSRVRLARNLRGFPFLTKAGPEHRLGVMDAVRAQLACAGLGPALLWANVHELPSLERTLLVERHLMSKELAKGDLPRGLAVTLPDERVSIMVNEEDHLRIQCVLPGMALPTAWAMASEADDRLEAGLDVAFSPRFGYLTACPTNVGTGVRMSVMLHLPALRSGGEIEKVKRAASDMGLSVRGFYGENSEASGDFFQISNQRTLGRPEGLILAELHEQIVPTVIAYERAARRQLLVRQRRTIEDQCGRALGLLRHARLLTPEETMGALSLVRLGRLLQIADCPAIATDDAGLLQLMLQVQPAHLQRIAERQMDQQQRREFRADLVRQTLAARPENGPSAGPVTTPAPDVPA